MKTYRDRTFTGLVLNRITRRSRHHSFTGSGLVRWIFLWLLLLSLINQLNLLIVIWLLICALGKSTTVTLTRYLARDRVCLRVDRSQALSFQLLHRIIHTVTQGKLILPLLNVDIQGVKILNDTTCISWLTDSLYTALIIVTVSALVVERQTANLLLLACRLLWLIFFLWLLLPIIMSFLTLFLQTCLFHHCFLSCVILA